MVEANSWRPHTPPVASLPDYTGFVSRCQDPASTSLFGLDRQYRLGSAQRALLLTLPAYSHFRCIHTSGVGSLFSRYPSCPAWSLRGYSHTPCLGSLFLRYPSRPAWSLHRSSHTPCVGSLFSRYPSRPAWSLRSFSHMPCVGSLFWGGMVAVPVTGIER